MKLDIDPQIRNVRCPGTPIWKQRSYDASSNEGCHAGKDGDCIWPECPQLRDNEPATSGRSCPLWKEESMLKTLEEHETERGSSHAGIFYPAQPRHNGIACPTCGAELYDSNPMEMLTSLPPKVRIHCECGYKGTRTA